MVPSNGSRGGPSVSSNKALVYKSYEVKLGLGVIRTIYGREDRARVLLGWIYSKRSSVLKGKIVPALKWGG